MTTASLEQLRSAMAAALQAGDDVQYEALAKDWRNHKADREKALAEAAAKESEALAGGREKLAIAIFKAIQRIPQLKELETVKASGFTFHVDVVKLDENGTDIGTKHTAVALLVPTLKVAKTRTASGGGVRGKTKAEFGLSSAEVLERFGTADEKAEGALLKTQGREDRADSKLYALQQIVKKRAIAEGKLQPVK